jgi:hypothetical protein
MTGIETIGQVLELGRKKNLQLTETDAAIMGPQLTAALMSSGDFVEVLEAVYETLRGELHEQLTSSNLTVRMQVMTALWRAYLVLAQGGCREAESLQIDMHCGLWKLGKAARKYLIGRMTNPRTSDEDAELIFHFLADMLWAKHPGWTEATWAVEAERCGL